MTDLIKKRDGEDFGGGANNALNYDLHCGECKSLLGPLGVFRERALDATAAMTLARIGISAQIGDIVKLPHCGCCHATTLVHGSTVTCMPGKALGMGNVCIMCDRPLVPGKVLLAS